MAIKNFINGIAPYCNNLLLPNIGFDMNFFSKGKSILKLLSLKGRFPKCRKPTLNRQDVPSYSQPPQYQSYLYKHTHRWFSNNGLVNNMRKIAATNCRNGNKTYPLFGLIGFGLYKNEEYEKNKHFYDFHSKMKEALPDLLARNFQNLFHGSTLNLNQFEFGKQLSKGCCGVVYSVTLNPKEVTSFSQDESAENEDLLESEGSTSHQCSDLAIKMMFNYSHDSQSSTILRGMQREMLPLASEHIKGEKDVIDFWKQERFFLPQHPNIIQMYGAFVEEFNVLPDGKEHYGAALPKRFLGYGHNNTLYLIMKKYDLTLQDYLDTYHPSYHTRLLLFSQLLEALAFLQLHNVAHRDLKPNNILLDLSKGPQDPQLVLADFGNALVKEGLKVDKDRSSPYQSLGGNTFYMAPELLQPQGRMLDFNRSDLWAAAAIACDIFGVDYLASNKDANVDIETNLPLPYSMSPALFFLLKACLNRDPSERPSPNLAATLCQILLFFPSFQQAQDSQLYAMAVLWLSDLSMSLKHPATLFRQQPKTSERNLKLTFLKRTDLEEVVCAMKYIRNFTNVDNK